MWQPLFANLAVAAIALVAWGAIGDYLTKLSQIRLKLVFGCAMALGTLGSMSTAFQPVPGVFYDLRGPLVAVSGFFGGPFAVAIVSGVAIVYRILMGGMVLPGIIGIILMTVVGLCGYAVCRSRAIRRIDITVLATAVAASGVVAVMTLPSAAREAIVPLLWAPVSLSFISTLLMGMILLHDLRQRELAVSNKLYRAMVDILPDCLNIKDTKGRFLAANPATAVLMQAESAEALIGKTDFDFYPRDVAMQFQADEADVLQAGENASIEQICIQSDGKRSWLTTLKMPIRADDGTIAGVITHNRDITSRKELQQRLEETQGYLDQALDNMNDGLAMFDASGVIIFCNDRYRELFPKTAHLRVSGVRFADIISYSVACGEERLEKGESLDSHVARKVQALHETGEKRFDIADGRTFLSRTKILANGHALRMISDVTERQMFERNLEYQAQHDPLTGLANRSLFNRELHRSIERVRIEDGALVVMLLDLDHFKQVNDSFGHAAGDALLVEVSRRLERSVRDGDLVARLGGDEFAILITDLPDELAEITMARRIMKGLVAPFDFDEIRLIPGATIGYTSSPRDASDADGLLRNADSALYSAKAKGRGSWKAFTPSQALKPAASRVS